MGHRRSTAALVPLDEARIACIADIIGSASASAQALAELHRRRASGEAVGLFADPSNPTVILVGPARTATF